MRKWIVFFIGICLLSAESFSHSKTVLDYKNIHGADFIVSCERSGTHWTIAILQILLKKPVRPIKNPNISTGKRVNLLNFVLDENEPILYRSHYIESGFSKIDQSSNRLLLIVRNYKELIARECSGKKITKRLKGKKIKQYMKNLSFYDLWKDDDTKLLIYYEDLISDPKNTIEKLLMFYDKDIDLVEEFMENIDYWQKKVYRSYINSQGPQHGKSARNAKPKEIYHTKNISLDDLKKVDRKVRDAYPVLWERYLNRYRSKS